MPTTEYCLYNETRSSFLTTRVTVINAQSEPLKAVKALIEGLEPGADSGATPALWLNPLKSVPSVPRLSPYDLVYLDHQGRVVQNIELVPDDEAPRFDGRAASALVLPIHSFNASGSSAGDRVLLRPAPKSAQERAATSVPAAASLAPSSAPAPQLSLPLGIVSMEPASVRAWASAFTANPFMPGDSLESEAAPAPRIWPKTTSPIHTGQGPVEPIQLNQQLSAAPASEPAPAILPAKSLIDFRLLRSLARLRIGLQLSISLEPAKAQSATPDARPASIKAEPLQQSRPLPLAPALIRARTHVARFAGSIAAACTASCMASAIRLRQVAHAASARAIFSQKRIRIVIRHASARLTDRCAFFSTVTLPIFFEHTLPATANRSRRRLVRLYTSSRKVYLQWADVLFDPPRPASIPGPPRRPPVSVRPVETRQDPLRQMLRPRG